MKQLYVFLILFCVISLTQLIWSMRYAYVCKHRDIIDPESEGGKRSFLINIGRRLKIAWLLLIVSTIAFCFGYAGITLLFFFISFLALREFVSIMHLKPSDYWPIFCSFYIFLPLQYFFVLTDLPFLFFIFLPVYVFLLSPMIAIASGDDEQFFERASKFQWAQSACIYCVSYIPAIAGMQLKNGHFESSTLLLFYTIVLLASDTFQYFFGNLLGKKKIAPKLSPLFRLHEPKLL